MMAHLAEPPFQFPLVSHNNLIKVAECASGTLSDSSDINTPRRKCHPFIVTYESWSSYQVPWAFVSHYRVIFDTGLLPLGLFNSSVTDKTLQRKGQSVGWELRTPCKRQALSQSYSKDRLRLLCTPPTPPLLPRLS